MHRILYVFSLVICTISLIWVGRMGMPDGRIPNSTYPLDGANPVAIRYRYVVFPKVHHVQFRPIRDEIRFLAQKFPRNQNLRDALVDFARPFMVQVMPTIVTDCSSLMSRYEQHQSALKRALAPYWVEGTKKNCHEIQALVVDEDGSQHLDYRTERREIGRVFIMREDGGALAQILLWRDDANKNNFAQVQPLDPNLDIGSGFSVLPVDWPRMKNYRDQVQNHERLRIPDDSYVKNYLYEQGAWPWDCSSQLMGVRFMDSWGRRARSQWCYGDAFPKIIENDHYFAFRLEE